VVLFVLPRAWAPVVHPRDRYSSWPADRVRSAVTASQCAEGPHRRASHVGQPSVVAPDTVVGKARGG